MPVTLYAHLTWTTFERRPLLDAPVAAFLRRFLPACASRFGVRVCAVGIAADHLHLLVFLPPVIDIPRLIQGRKRPHRESGSDHCRGATPVGEWLRPSVGVAARNQSRPPIHRESKGKTR
jgi:hypothetical protein